MGLVSGTSRHPKDVSFVTFGGAYGLGAISPRKQQISAIGVRPFRVFIQYHSPGVDTLFEPMSPRYTASLQPVQYF